MEYKIDIKTYNIITEWRVRHKITVKEASRALGVTPATLRKWEKAQPPHLVKELLKYWRLEEFGKVDSKASKLIITKACLDSKKLGVSIPDLLRPYHLESIQGL